MKIRLNSFSDEFSHNFGNSCPIQFISHKVLDFRAYMSHFKRDVLVNKSVISMKMRFRNLVNFDYVLTLKRNYFVNCLGPVLQRVEGQSKLYGCHKSWGFWPVEGVRTLLLQLYLVFGHTF